MKTLDSEKVEQLIAESREKRKARKGKVSEDSITAKVLEIAKAAKKGTVLTTADVKYILAKEYSVVSKWNGPVRYAIKQAVKKGKLSFVGKVEGEMKYKVVA